MPVPTDITAGTLTITNGSTAVTGTGTSWLASDLRQGDIILWIEGGDGFQTPILADVPASNTALTLAEPWEGPTLTGARYRIRYQWDSSRVSAQSRQLIEMLDNGNVLALSGLTGPGVPVFDGPHSMVVRPETDFINGVAYDVQVDTLADRAAYDGQAEGFAVLVSDVGDGRSALYSKVSNTVGDWSDPAYITGGVGPTPDIEATVTNTAPGTTPTVTPVPITGGTRLDFTLPEASGFYNAGVYDIGTAYDQDDVVRFNGSAFIALQSVPAGTSPSSAFPPVDTSFWQVLVVRGANGTGTVASVVGGVNVTVDSSDPANPVVSAAGGIVFSSTLTLLPGAGNRAANITAINAAASALNAVGGGILFYPSGTYYAASLDLYANVVHWGAGRWGGTHIIDDVADGFPTFRSANQAVTIFGPEIRDMRISKISATGGSVIDLTSCQQPMVHRCWITSSSALGTALISGRGLWNGTEFTTEGTGAKIRDNYMGLAAFMLRLGPNANSWEIGPGNRMQVNVSNGTAVYLGTTGAPGEVAVEGFPNDTRVKDNLIERTNSGGVSGTRALLVAPEADDVTFADNRVEGDGIGDAVVAQAGATGVVIGKNHFSSITGKKVTGAGDISYLYPYVLVRAHKNGTDQTGIASATDTKITFNTETVDRSGDFDTSTSRFQPNFPGYYRVSTQLYMTGGQVDGALMGAKLYKNGVLYSQFTRANGAALFGSTAVSDLVYMNGTTDYLEVFFNGGGAGDKTINGASNATHFTAEMV